MIYFPFKRNAICKNAIMALHNASLSNSKDIQIVTKKAIEGKKNYKTSHYKIKVKDSRHKKRTDIRFLKSFCYLREDIA